jgi:outer membrane protein assembly factor BamB
MMRCCHSCLLLLLVASQAGADWPRFRGPDGTGISTAPNVPLTWDARTNIRWRVDLPGPGTSSPVLFRARIYLTCYTGYGLDAKARGDHKNLKRHLLCISRDGTIVWDRALPATTAEPGYGGFTALHGYASSTPAVDAAGIYVFYGASGAAAYDHDGNLRWQKSCGTQRHEDWGSASSPIIHGDLVIIHADVESESIYALDKQTGREVWRRTFPSDKQHSRATPLVLRRPSGDELVIHSRMTWLTALAPRDGQTLWEYQGTSSYQHPSPVSDGDLVYALTYQHAVAVRPGGARVWELKRGSEICTPLCHAGHLYWANEEGMAFCIDASAGKLVYAERLQPDSGRIYASGVLAEGRIYYVSREKGTYVVPAEPKYRLLAHNRIDDDASVFNATPAFDEGRIYLRSDRRLYCIGSR